MSEFSDFNNTFTMPAGIKIQYGGYPELKGWEAAGYNPNVGTNFETIWDGSNVYSFPASALQMTVSSAAGATDDGVDVTILGLDTDYNEITETVTLDDSSAGAATTTNSFLRINRAFVSNGQAPTADITIANGGTTYALIDSPNNTTEMAIYTVPAGKRAYLVYASISLEKQKEVIAKLIARKQGGVFVTSGKIGTTRSFERHWVIPPVFDEKTDIQIQALAGATTSISADMQFVLEDK